MTYLAWEVVIDIIQTAIAVISLIEVVSFQSMSDFTGGTAQVKKNPARPPGLVTEQIFLLLQKEMFYTKKLCHVSCAAFILPLNLNMVSSL